MTAVVSVSPAVVSTQRKLYMYLVLHKFAKWYHKACKTSDTPSLFSYDDGIKYITRHYEEDLKMHKERWPNRDFYPNLTWYTLLLRVSIFDRD
jgi:hypothetical protein